MSNEVLNKVLEDNNITKEILEKIYNNAIISGAISFMVDFNEYVKMINDNQIFICCR